MSEKTTKRNNLKKRRKELDKAFKEFIETGRHKEINPSEKKRLKKFLGLLDKDKKD